MEENKITVQDWAIRARSKKEIYEFLVVQGNDYLPPIQDYNHEFVRDIIQGTKRVSMAYLSLSKKYIKGRDAKLCQVPMLKTLKVKET